MNILYAIKNEELVFIDDVENGLKCNCFCAACGERLIAKNGGKKKIHHFSHHTDADCVHGYETSIHLLSKKILMESKWFQVPDLNLAHELSNIKFQIFKSERFTFDNVETEVGFEGIIPDLTCYVDSNIKMFIEIKVTHGIDEAKYTKLKSYGIPTLEIDLSGIDREIDEATLKEILHRDLIHKEWVFHNLIIEYHEKIHSIAIPISPKEKSFSLSYDGRPISSNIYKGKSYMNVMDDCSLCEEYIEWNENGICCLGNKYVSTKDEIDNLFNEYKRNPELFEFRKKADDQFNLGELWKKNGNKPFRAINIYSEMIVDVSVDPYQQWKKYKGKCFGRLQQNGKYYGSREIYYSGYREWKFKD